MAERDVIIRIRAIDQASAVFSRVALAAGAFLSYWALQRGVRVVTEAFIEAEATSITLAAALRATGNAAGFSAEELEDYADELMRLTTVDDDAFKRIMGIMATFRNVHGEVFKESIELVADMSVQFGGLESGAIRLGKALNDPVLGMSALSRVGIQFSKAQKESIELFAEQNNMMGAQTIILAELANQFGGQARAQVNSFGGAIKQLGNAFGQVKEDMGEFIAEIPGLITGIQFATVAIENIGLTWDIIVLRVALGLAGIQADFTHVFTEAIPQIIQFFKDNWMDMLITLESLLGSFFDNLLKNAWNLVLALKDIFTGGTFDVVFVSMLDGFENTIGKFPDIARRGMNDVERAIAEELDEALEELLQKFVDRVAGIPTAREPGEPFLPAGVDEAEKVAARKQADLIADESRFLTFGRVAGDAAIEAGREAKRAARIAQEQREKQSRQLERIARRAEIEIGPGDDFFLNSWAGLFSELLGKGGAPGMIAPVKPVVVRGHDENKAVRLAEKAERNRERQVKLLEKIAGEKRGPRMDTMEISVSNFR